MINSRGKVLKRTVLDATDAFPLQLFSSGRDLVVVPDTLSLSVIFTDTVALLTI